MRCGTFIFTILLGLVAVSSASAAEPKRQGTALDAIRVGGVIGERIALTVTNNLMKLDYDKDFIRPFVVKDGKKNFIGTGNVIESLVALAKYTGDAKVLELKRRLVKAVIDAQTPEGYIGCMQPEKRVWYAWDVEDIGFILDGLVLDWTIFGERASLDAVIRAADHTLANWKNPPKDFDKIVYDKELLMGLGHGLLSLAAATGERRYADFVSQTMRYGTDVEPIVLGRDMGLRGQADGYLDTCLTHLALYDRTGEAKLLRQFNLFLGHFLRGNGALIHGLEGISECFSGDQDGAGFAGETCMSAYLLCTLDAALRTGAMESALAGDVMERVLYNAFFAAQSRDGRKLRYYTPVVGKRPYWPMDDYCCPCNFRRVMGHLPEYVFYSSADEILANLYTAAEATLTAGGTAVRVREETAYPTDGEVLFRLDPEKPADFTFALRLPRWCREPSVCVNGEKVADARPGTVLRLSRTWKGGDVVTASFPMPVRLVRGRARQQGRCAIMRGPLVYAVDDAGLAMNHGKWIEGSGNDEATPAEVMVVYPETLRLVKDDASARTGGTAVSATVSLVPYQLGRDCGFAEPVEVRFTEFPDPANTLTYFRVPSIASCGAVDDELFSGDQVHATIRKGGTEK